jgi:hypothetical protein
MDLAGISREKACRCFLDCHDGLDGFLVSFNHPRFTMLGPGVTRTPEQAASLLLAELNRCRGRTPVFLVPAGGGVLVRQMYQWGAKDCEIHFSQVRGPCPPVRAIRMPTFLPERG